MTGWCDVIGLSQTNRATKTHPLVVRDNKFIYRRGTARRAMSVGNFSSVAQLYENLHLKRLAIGEWPQGHRKLIGQLHHFLLGVCPLSCTASETLPLCSALDYNCDPKKSFSFDTAVKLQATYRRFASCISILQMMRAICVAIYGSRKGFKQLKWHSGSVKVIDIGPVPFDKPRMGQFQLERTTLSVISWLKRVLVSIVS